MTCIDYQPLLMYTTLFDLVLNQCSFAESWQQILLDLMSSTMPSKIIVTPITVTLQPITALNYTWYHWKAHVVLIHLMSELV